MYRLYASKFWKAGAVPVHLEFRNPQAPFPPHTHDFYEIAVVYNGKGTHFTEHGSTELRAGHVLFVKPGQSHGYKKISNLVLMNLLLHTPFLQESNFELNQINGYQQLFGPLPQNEAASQSVCTLLLNKFQLFEVRAIIESIKFEVTNQNPGYATQITSLLVQLMVYLLRVYGNRHFSSASVNTQAESLIAFMEKNYTESLTMQDLTDLSGMSESGVLRTFKRITGYSPFAYQNRLRMFDATNRLSATEKSITEIAFDLGFEDSNYFCRCFRKFMDMTPSAYRKQYGETRP